jgi:hypothetical protein
MQKKTILASLQADCPFPKLFEEIENPGAFPSRYRRKIVHFRADYDGRKWWNTIWPMHDELATPEIRREIDNVYAALTAKDAWADLQVLTAFCREHPEALANSTATDEFNFYYEGELCWYWLRCITRSRDYNLYLHAFLKSDLEGGAAYEH